MKPHILLPFVTLLGLIGCAGESSNIPSSPDDSAGKASDPLSSTTSRLSADSPEPCGETQQAESDKPGKDDVLLVTHDGRTGELPITPEVEADLERLMGPGGVLSRDPGVKEFLQEVKGRRGKGAQKSKDDCPPKTK